MFDCTGLLVSTERRLIQEAEEVGASIERLRLEVCGEIDEARSRLERDDVALVLVHLTARSDDAEVTRFASSVAARKPACAAVLLSDQYRDHQAIAFRRAGATEYLGLPMSAGRLSHLMDSLTLCARLGLHQQSAAVDRFAAPNGRNPLPLALTPGMVELMERIRQLGPHDTTVLLSGETGTGKTRVARLVHELSPRRGEPFFVLDCGSLSPGVIESEMFGHVKGAFTGADRERIGKFAAAGGGTLLLDEVNSLPPALQSKLLRAVDERLFEPVGSNQPVPLRARLVAASNTLLEDEVAAGRFRADLYYRLNVVGFHLPPLREQRAAVGPLANQFLAEFAARGGRAVHRIAPDALRALEEYAWPGNIRQLRNTIERAVALCPGSEVQMRDLPVAVRASGPCLLAAAAAAGRRPQAGGKAEVLRITAALAKHGNNRLRAAAELGISRVALYKKLHKYGLMGRDSRVPPEWRPTTGDC